MQTVILITSTWGLMMGMVFLVHTYDVMTARDCYKGTNVFNQPQCNGGPNHPLMNIMAAHYEVSTCAVHPVCTTPSNSSVCQVHVPTVDQDYYSLIQRKCGGQTECKQLRPSRFGNPVCSNCLLAGATDQIRIDFTCEKELQRLDLCKSQNTTVDVKTGLYLHHAWDSLTGQKTISNCQCTLKTNSRGSFQMRIMKAYSLNMKNCLSINGTLNPDADETSRQCTKKMLCDGNSSTWDTISNLHSLTIDIERPGRTRGLVWVEITGDANISVKCHPTKTGDLTSRIMNTHMTECSTTEPITGIDSTTVETAYPNSTVTANTPTCVKSQSNVAVIIVGVSLATVIVLLVLALVVSLLYIRHIKQKMSHADKQANDTKGMDTYYNLSPTTTGQQTASKDFIKTTNDLTHMHSPPKPHTISSSQSHGDPNLQRQKSDNYNQPATGTMTQCEDSTKNSAYTELQLAPDIPEYTEIHHYEPITTNHDPTLA